MNYRVLSLSPDTTLAETRRRLFEQAGYTVFTQTEVEQASGFVRDNRIDLVLICHSYEATVRRCVVEELRATTNARILLIHQFEIDPPLAADAHFLVSQGPETLLHVAERALVKQLSAAS